MEEEKYKKNTNHDVIFSNHPPAATVGEKIRTRFSASSIAERWG
jgi:hypothetical protein